MLDGPCCTEAFPYAVHRIIGYGVFTGLLWTLWQARMKPPDEDVTLAGQQ